MTITQTTPASTPLDTLKALVLRNIDHLDYILDRLAGGFAEVPEDDLEFLEFIRQNQYKAIAEHLPVADDDRLNELRYPHPDALQYDDGSPVVERFEAKYGASVFYPRYDGPRDEALKRHQDWTRQYELSVDGKEELDNIVDGINWGGGK